MAKTVGNSVDAFSIACRKSAADGAASLIEYIGRIQQVNGGAEEAFRTAVHNIAYIYGIPVALGTGNSNGFKDKHPTEYEAIMLVKRALNIN